MDTLKSFKMKSGEEVIGSVTGVIDGMIMISKPRVVHLRATPEGLMVDLLPYLLSNPDVESIGIEDSAIATSMVTPAKGMQTDYINSTSAVQIPDAPSIITK